jgi:Protein of unknown function (DUF2490)
MPKRAPSPSPPGRPAARRVAGGAFALVAACAAPPARAQPRGKAADPGDGPSGVWTSLEARVPVAGPGSLVPSHLRWVTETRFGRPAGGVSLLLVRAGPLWDVHPNLLVAVNAVQNVQAESARSFVPETRVELEPTVRASFGPLALNQRLRLEHRWFPGERRVRVRLQERLSYRPAGQFWAPFVSSEAHADLSGEGFNEWRNVVGVSLQAGEALRVDVGYMARFEAEAGGATRQGTSWGLDHVLSLALAFSPKAAPLVVLDAP